MIYFLIINPFRILKDTEAAFETIDLKKNQSDDNITKTYKRLKFNKKKLQCTQTFDQAIMGVARQ